MNDAIAKNGEYVQFDFGKNPAAIAGFRALGNTAIDSSGRYSSTMYYQVPDLVRMERSQDGLKWDIIEGSFSTFSFAQEVEVVW